MKRFLLASPFRFVVASGRKQNIVRKGLIVRLIVLVLLPANLAARPQFGDATLFNEGWKFQLADVKDGASPSLNDDRWRMLDLPHDWSSEAFLSPDRASCTGFLPGGVGWYRKSFEWNAADSQRKAFIYFEGVYQHSTVYLNGTKLGERPNGYISFGYDLSPYLQTGTNLLAVRVDHSRDADSRWYTGSGIYRNVYLVKAEPVHLDLWGVYFRTGKVTDSKAEVLLEATLKNETSAPSALTVLHELIDPSTGKVVSKTQKNLTVQPGNTTVKQVMQLASPKRWSIDEPFLYQVRTTIRQKTKVLEQNIQALGIRTLTFDADRGFAINGEWTKMKGVCLHHDAGSLGAAVPREVWKRRLAKLKELGCNAIRMSHNPQAPDLYELCDEMGFLVMDEAFDEWEFAKKKWIAGWNKGTPGFQGAAEFFNEWCERDLKDMVLRDRNHPSIVLWSIGNEVDYPNDPYSHPVLDHAGINQPVQGGYQKDRPKAERLGEIAKRLAAVVRGLDTSRPVTAALAGVVMSNETEYPGALDVCGYNYTEDRYAKDHKAYPQRVIYGSENGHGYDAWKIVRDNDYIFGQFLWTGIDHLGESHGWPSRGSYPGLLDLGGFVKPRGYFRQALWSEKPVAYLGTYVKRGGRNYLSMDASPLWNYNEGETIRVVCYTNAEQAKLLLNGQQVGDIQDRDDKTGILFWDLPFQPGKLEVVGMNKNAFIQCSYALETSGRPAQILANPDVATLKKGEVCQIEIQVTDDRNLPVVQADDEISCRVEGPARLLGLESGNMHNTSYQKAPVQRVSGGKLVAYVQGTGGQGEVKVQFSAPWLYPATVRLIVE